MKDFLLLIYRWFLTFFNIVPSLLSRLEIIGPEKARI